MTLKVPFSPQISKFPDLNNRRSQLYQAMCVTVMGGGQGGGPLGNYGIREGSSYPKRLDSTLTSSLDDTAFLWLSLESQFLH